MGVTAFTLTDEFEIFCPGTIVKASLVWDSHGFSIMHDLSIVSTVESSRFNFDDVQLFATFGLGGCK